MTDVTAGPTAPVQRWDAAGYADNARFVTEGGRPLLDLLAPRPGLRVLDLGCGDGALTAELAATGAAVIGVDASATMVAAACARGLDARVMDGHALDFERMFDAVLSNAALHWMTAPQAVLTGVARALKPGGRFVGEFGGHGNIATVIAALRTVHAARRPGVPLALPWYFPTAEEYRERLTVAGFAVETIRLFDRPSPLPTGLAGWLETFIAFYLEDLPATERTDVVSAVCDAAASGLRQPDGRWVADYVRLRFSARLLADAADRPWV